MIDGKIEVSGSAAVGTKFVSGAEAFVPGHFPGNPLFPGALTLECMSEVAEELGRTLSGDPECHTAEIRRLRLIEPILAGDVLTVSAVASEESFGYVVEGQATSQGRLKASGMLIMSRAEAGR